MQFATSRFLQCAAFWLLLHFLLQGSILQHVKRCQYWLLRPLEVHKRVVGQVEAGAAKDELKRLRKEMLRLKNEWTTLKALYESAKVQMLHATVSSRTWCPALCPLPCPYPLSNIAVQPGD